MSEKMEKIKIEEVCALLCSKCRKIVIAPERFAATGAICCDCSERLTSIDINKAEITGYELSLKVR